MTRSYAERLQAQLADYKRHELHIHDDGVWARNGQAYPHILPASLSEMNLCGALREHLLVLIATHETWTKHRDFCHLNSSQAMCWNLLMPALLLPGGLEHLAAALDTPAMVEAIDFETIPDIAEFTNFDCVLQLAGGGTVYLEAKLTEREFGAAAKNSRREQKRTGMYLPRLAGKVSDELLAPDAFFANYQLLRNLSHLKEPTDRLVLLIPRESHGLVAQAQAFRERALPPWQSQVSIVFVEELIDRLESLSD